MKAALLVSRLLLIVGLILAVVAVLMVLFVEGDSSTYWAAAIGVPGVALVGTSRVVWFFGQHVNT